MKVFIIFVFIIYAILIIGGLCATHGSNRTVNQINMAKLIKNNPAVFFIGGLFVSALFAMVAYFYYFSCSH